MRRTSRSAIRCRAVRGRSPVTKPLIQTTGRRKESLARVLLRPATGVITVTGRELVRYFPILTPQHVGAGLCRAAGRVLGADRPFVVGRDTRRSGPLLEAALVAGLCSEGADVERVGVLPTPGVAYLAQMFDAPAAVLSASHNPYPDNGVKLFARGGRKIADAPEEQIETELRRLVDAGAGDGPEGPGVGIVRDRLGGAADDIAHLSAALGDRRLDGQSVVVDCGNGAAFEVAPWALRVRGAWVRVLHDEPDGTNINAGCGSTDPADLQQAVVAAGADAGLAFDGDADRVIAV